jgi:hypothetical protein
MWITAAVSIKALAKVKKTRGGVNPTSLKFRVLIGVR